MLGEQEVQLGSELLELEALEEEEAQQQEGETGSQEEVPPWMSPSLLWKLLALPVRTQQRCLRDLLFK